MPSVEDWKVRFVIRLPKGGDIRIIAQVWIKDRHQWLGREFRGSLSLIMDRLFLKAIIHELYH